MHRSLQNNVLEHQDQMSVGDLLSDFINTDDKFYIPFMRFLSKCR